MRVDLDPAAPQIMGGNGERRRPALPLDVDEHLLDRLLVETPVLTE